MLRLKQVGGRLEALDGDIALWSRRVDNATVIKASEPGASCGELRHRGDKKILRGLCLDDSVLGVDVKNGVVNIVDGASGATTYAMKIYGTIVDAAMSGNRLAIAYMNVVDMRYELALVEVYELFPAVDSLQLMQSTWLPNIFPPPTLEGEVHTYEASYVLPVPSLASMAFTHTKSHITPQTLVIFSPANELLYAADPVYLSARRGLKPGSVDPETLSGVLPSTDVEVDVPPYDPILKLAPLGFVEPQEPQRALFCEPTLLESTSVCHINGQSFRVAPAHAFDSLPENFSKSQTLGFVLAMLVFLLSLVHKVRNSAPPKF